ncbi:MAG: site-specific integrase [Crocinitomicaceae bacterium]|nr:site-specific integrase [Crocinitomicaceae bacterium]
MIVKIVFNRRKQLNANGDGLIEFQIYLTRTKRPTKSTGIYIAPVHWDDSKKCIKKTFKDADKLNAELHLKKNELENYYLNEFLKTGSRDRVEVRKKIDLYDFIDNYVIKVSNLELSEGTQKIYRRLSKYLKQFHPKGINIDEINVAYCELFNAWLVNERKLCQNTRHQLTTKLKRCISIAVKLDYLEYAQNPFVKGFAVREIPTIKKALDLTELTILENVDLITRPELVKCKDRFLFCCYTGLRYGDFNRLTIDNFDFLENGKIRLKYVPHKTMKSSGKLISWIVSDFWAGKIDSLIHKYQGDFRSFTKITNQKHNEQLKELQRFAGIKQPLHSHLARHTCISVLINDYGLSVDNVQMIAGHSKIETTMGYLKKTEKDLANAASKVVWG